MLTSMLPSETPPKAPPTKTVVSHKQHVREMLHQHLSSLSSPLVTPLGEALTVLPLREGWCLELGAISHFAASLFLGCLFFFIPTRCTSVVGAILFDRTIHHRA